jgi:sodium-dependent dicarboxylate transporter 2/3/5
VAQKRLLLILLTAVFLWILPGIVQLAFGMNHEITHFVQKRLPEGVVAISMAVLLFIVRDEKKNPLFKWEDAQEIDWGTLILFGSGISLGLIMFDTGLAAVIGNLLPFKEMSPPVALLLLSALTLFATEFVSNTATSNLLIPLVMTTAPFTENPYLPVIIVALSANMAFMLPVGTPPNAIAYATGKVKMSSMISKGVKLNFACLVLIWISGLIS